MDIKELSGKSLNDLRIIAESIGITDVQSLKKHELIARITGDNAQDNESTEAPASPKVKTRPRKQTTAFSGDVENITARCMPVYSAPGLMRI